MINNIVTLTNTYAGEHIFSGFHQSYTSPYGSWRETTTDEIKRLIAPLIYIGLVKIGDLDSYWSIRTLNHCLWLRAIMSRTRFKVRMAMLHVADPAKEDRSHKLRKVESFLIILKCHALYQPRQHWAIDERMVKSHHRSGIRLRTVLKVTP